MPAAHVAEQPLPGATPDACANENDVKRSDEKHLASTGAEPLKNNENQKNGSDNEQGDSGSSENRCVLTPCCISLY